MADNNVAYTLADPAAFWSQLPALRSLKLQQVGLVFRGSGVIDDSRAVRVEGEPDAAQGGLSDRVVLWVRDLPCRQLQRLELSRYYLVVEQAAAAASTAAGGRCVQQGHQGACGSSSSSVQQTRDTTANPTQQQQQGSEASRAAEVTGFAGLSLADKQQDVPFHNPGSNSSSSSSDLSGLQHLALVDCCCLLLPAARQSAASHTASTSSSSAPHKVQVASLRHLLAHVASPTQPHSSSSLRSLTLHSVILTVDDLAAIAALGDQLEELDVRAQFGWMAFGVAPTPAAVAATSALNDILAAAARDRKLQQLRRLSLLLSQPRLPKPCSEAPLVVCLSPLEELPWLVSALLDGCNDKVCLTPSVLLGCSALRSLQELRLLLRADADVIRTRCPGWCSCCAAAVPRAGPWKELLRLQHLQRGRITTRHSRICEPLHDPDGGHGLDIVLGVCGECGGAVSGAQYHALVEGVAAVRLPGFVFDVQMSTSRF